MVGTVDINFGEAFSAIYFFENIFQGGRDVSLSLDGFVCASHVDADTKWVVRIRAWDTDDGRYPRGWAFDFLYDVQLQQLFNLFLNCSA